MKHVNIYTATSLKGIRRQDGVIGYILEFKDNQTHTMVRFAPVQQVTQNQAALICITKALSHMCEKCEIDVFTECDGLLAVQNGWMCKWVHNHWKNSKGKDVANKAEWLNLLSATTGHKVRVHIKENHEYKSWLQHEIERRT